MIPKNVREGAVAHLPGEKANFSIEANGKAFRTLIDGLYSNKVRSVIRELCSNAADSHIEAGQTRPFKVSIPTSLDPTFRVRDYGVGLDHEGVMTLYTTIFRSTKEKTNDQTGQLGLGSKSPFAYTDTFSVVAYDGHEKRVYVAYLETDGVPAINHVGTEPSTEDRGLEVSFPAKRSDVHQFQTEMQFVALGHKIPPEVEGMRVEYPKPRMSGSNWAIYPAGALGNGISQQHYVRQGSVIYPVHQGINSIGYGWITVVDIPIGTADVTASRESLSMDSETARALDQIRRQVENEISQTVENLRSKIHSRVETAKFFSEYNGILTNLRGSTSVSLLDTTADGRPGDTLELSTMYGKPQQTRYSNGRRWVHGVEVREIPRIKILVDDVETKVVRRTKRVRMVAGPYTYVLTVEDPNERKEAINWIKGCFEIGDDQFELVSALPDHPPARKPRTASKPRVLAPKQFWMRRSNGVVSSDIFGDSNRGPYELPNRLTYAAKDVGYHIVWDDIFWVNDRQYDSLKAKGLLPEDRRLDVHVKALVEKYLDQAGIEKAETYATVAQMVGRYNNALPVVIETFFPQAKGVTEAQANKISQIAGYIGKNLQHGSTAGKIKKEIDSLAREYPLLFQKSERAHFEHYIKAVKATQSK